MSDREEIADAIMSTHRVERHPELRRANSLVEADGVLASAWLTRHDAEVAVKALEDVQEALVLKDAFTERSLRVIDEQIAARQGSIR